VFFAFVLDLQRQSQKTRSRPRWKPRQSAPRLSVPSHSGKAHRPPLAVKTCDSVGERAMPVAWEAGSLRVSGADASAPRPPRRADGAVGGSGGGDTEG
jgi:hypothetical protein